MFVKFFKDRSIRKFIEKILESRTRYSDNNKIQTVGVILNLSEFKDFEKLKDFLTRFGINENKIRFITFLSENDTKLNHWDSYFGSSWSIYKLCGPEILIREIAPIPDGEANAIMLSLSTNFY